MQSNATSCAFALLFRLFREATQLKTVATAERVAGLSRIHHEAQIDTVRPKGRNRPNGTLVADAVQRARGAAAEARGGASL